MQLQLFTADFSLFGPDHGGLVHVDQHDFLVDSLNGSTHRSRNGCFVLDVSIKICAESLVLDTETYVLDTKTTILDKTTVLDRKTAVLDA